MIAFHLSRFSEVTTNVFSNFQMRKWKTNIMIILNSFSSKNVPLYIAMLVSLPNSATMYSLKHSEMPSRYKNYPRDLMSLIYNKAHCHFDYTRMSTLIFKKMTCFFFLFSCSSTVNIFFSSVKFPHTKHLMRFGHGKYSCNISLK